MCLLIIKAKCNGKIIPSHNSQLISNGLLGIQSTHHLVNWRAYIKWFYDCFWNSNILFVIIRCKLVELLSLFTKFTFFRISLSYNSLHCTLSFILFNCFTNLIIKRITFSCNVNNKYIRHKWCYLLDCWLVTKHVISSPTYFILSNKMFLNTHSQKNKCQHLYLHYKIVNYMDISWIYFYMNHGI